MNGDLSVLRFYYGKALTASEIEADYNNTKYPFINDAAFTPQSSRVLSRYWSR